MSSWLFLLSFPCPTIAQLALLPLFHTPFTLYQSPLQLATSFAPAPLPLRYFPLLKRGESEDEAKEKRRTNGKLTENERRSIENRYGDNKTTISRLQAEIKRLCMLMDAKDNQIERLNRVAYPRRYRLSSGADLERIFVPNYLNPSLHIWTKVEGERFDNIKFDIPDDIAQKHYRGELTDEEFVNAVF